MPSLAGQPNAAPYSARATDGRNEGLNESRKGSGWEREEKAGLIKKNLRDHSTFSEKWFY